MYARLRQFRESLGLTQAEFGKSIGIAKSTYNNYEVGAREPKSDFWIAIAQKYNVTIDYLMGFSDDPYVTTDNISSFQFSSDEMEHIKKYRVLDVHGRRVVDSALDLEYDRMTHVVEHEQRGAITYINCYDLAVSAGPGEPWSGDQGYKTRIEIPTEQVPENAHYCVRVNGDSMEPAYHDGDIVFVQRQDEMIRKGDIGIFFLNGNGYIKRLGSGELISLNPKYGPIPIHDYDDLRCQGRALGRLNDI